MRAYSARVMGPSLSSAAHARPSAATARAVRDSRAESAPAPTSGKALPSKRAASPEAVRAFVRKRAEEFLGGGSEEHVSSSLRRLVRAQNRALERSLDRDTRETLSVTANADAARTPRAHPFSDETLDVLFRRRLLLLQARKGYRCNVDSLLLAAHAAEALRRRVSVKKTKYSPPPRVADLGAGAGVVGFAVALRPVADDQADTTFESSTDGSADRSADRSTRVLSIERQASLASRCARNAALNGLGHRVTVWRGDVKDVVGAASGASEEKEKEKEETRAVLAPWLRTCDAVVVNPPYYELDSKRAAGTQPRETERRDAHYETTATLLDFARAAEALLSPEEEDEANGGERTKTPPPTAHFVYPADRAAAVAAACAAAGLADVTIKRVFTDERARRANAAPALALIDARRGANEPIKNKNAAGAEDDARGVVLVNDSCVLYADEAQRTYGEEVETFMRNLGL